MSNQDRKKLRQLRHAVKEAVEALYLGTRPLARPIFTRQQALMAYDTLEIALSETAPEPDPGDALDAAEIHPHAPER